MRTKKTLYVSIVGLAILSMITLSCFSQPKEQPTSNTPDLPKVGVLTAYYAEEDFTAIDMEYKKGQLICDSNDPINRIVEQGYSYKYEGDETGGYYSHLLPKSKVKKVTYTMNQLPDSMFNGNAIFKSEQGFTAKLFKADINGHKFYKWVDKGDSGFEAVYSDEETKRHAQFLVLSLEFIFPWMEEKGRVEIKLNVKDGNIDFYHENRYCSSDDPADCRYRKGLIGFLEEEWVNKDGWEGAAFSEDGKLLVDQYSVDGSIPEYYSIAYIADQDAIYWNGTLYYRQ